MNSQTEWNFYENRWKFRDFYFEKVLSRHILVKYFGVEPKMYLYGGKRLNGIKRTNQILYDALLDDRPFMAARFGNTEIWVMVCILRERLFGKTEENTRNFEEWFNLLNSGAGFFPKDEALAGKFADELLDSCRQVDLLAMWHRRMEDYIIRKYIPHCQITYLRWLEPWYAKEKPWTSALKGKKVLVIHPFEKSIREQYAKREKLFPRMDILPEFDLKILKAVQTSAGGTDDRFADWFEALDYMYQEAMKIEFEVAIIGCGAYGMPLAARLKKAGKKVIHLGGVTQCLFGIKGRRWVESRVDRIPFNEEWIYPSAEETPKNASVVEIGCYWDFTTKNKDEGR